MKAIYYNIFFQKVITPLFAVSGKGSLDRIPRLLAPGWFVDSVIVDKRMETSYEKIDT